MGLPTRCAVVHAFPTCVHSCNVVVIKREESLWFEDGGAVFSSPVGQYTPLDSLESYDKLCIPR